MASAGITTTETTAAPEHDTLSSTPSETMIESQMREIENLTPEERLEYDNEIEEVLRSMHAEGAPAIDENTAKALQDNASWRMIQFLKRKRDLSKNKDATFKLRLKSSHGFKGGSDLLTCDLARSLRAAMGMDAHQALPSKHCYISRIDIEHANNSLNIDTGLKVQGGKIRGSCVCGVSLEDADSESTQDNHLVVMPSNSTLPAMQNIYTSRGFEETDTFLKYGDALKYNIHGAVHTEIPTSASVDYISPFTLGDQELQSIETEDFTSFLTDRQLNKDWKIHGDYYLHLLAKNYKNFEKPATFMTRPSVVKGSEDIWALTYNKKDRDMLCANIDNKIMKALKEHIIDLDDPSEKQLKFEFVSAHNDYDGVPKVQEDASAKDHVGALLSVTAVFV
jgi:hypothetical protein